MKEFMMIFIGGDYFEADLSPEQIQQRMEKWDKWIDRLKEDDLFINGRALNPSAKRVADGEVVTDGPFVETKELVGGYLLIKAKNMDDALKLTDGYPDYDLGGSVEVREIMNY